MTDYKHQTVRLMGMTQPEDCTDEFGYYEAGRSRHKPDAEDMIAYCARVSNPANQTNYDTAPKLLKYCIRKKHWSIFEMVNLVMEVKTTRDIGRQILRHGFKFQEFSQRYAKVDTDSFVLREARFQDTKNRQNSIPIDFHEDHQIALMVAEEWERRQQAYLLRVQEDYEWAIENGIAKECARVSLPEGNTMSCMYMQGTLRNWFHYSLLRKAKETQAEHRDIAYKTWNILTDKFDFLNDISVED